MPTVVRWSPRPEQICTARCSSRARPRTRARARWSPGSAAGSRARGVAVAPFKAQNMSNNSVVTADGGEIGRAQAMQAHACGLAPSVAFNPVLLKPGSDRSSQVVVLGQAQGTVSAMSYRAAQGRAARRRHRRPWPTCARATTWSSARARARPPRSTCGPPTSPTWGWRRPRTCRSSWSATSTAAACSRTCSARSPCSTPADQARIAGFVDQQVPRRPGPARAGAGAAAGAHRAADARRGPVGRRAVARRRGLALGGHRRRARPAGAAARVAVAAGGGRAVPADLQRDRRRGAGLRAGRRGAVRHRAVAARGRRTSSCCRARRRPWRTWPGCGAPGWPTRWSRTRRPGGRCWGSAAATRCWGGGSRTRTGSRAGRRTGWGCSTWRSSSRPTRCWRTRRDGLGAPGARLRDPPRAGGAVRRPARWSTDEGSDAGAVLGTHWHGLLENDGFRRALLARVAEQAGRAGFRAAPGHVVRRRAGRAARPARRPRRAAPRHRGPASMSSVTARRRISRS